MAYFIAGVSAFLSSLCYSEYAVEFPVAGGSFTFILYTFGEFWAWITATNLIFNYGELHVFPQHPVVGAECCLQKPTPVLLSSIRGRHD